MTASFGASGNPASSPQLKHARFRRWGPFVALVAAAGWAALTGGCAGLTSESLTRTHAAPRTETTVAAPAADEVWVDPHADAIAKIREEGLTRSRVMDTLDYLTNMIGPRLTSSPQLRRANDWALARLTEWGLENAHLDEWGPFGRGWSLEAFSMQVTSPDTIILQGYPRAWSPGFDAPVTAEIVHLTATNDAELQAFAGQLEGKIVLLGQIRPLEARFEPLATRITDAELQRLAAATGNRPARGVTNPAGGVTNPAATQPANAETPLPGQARADTAGERAAAFADTPAGVALRAAATRRTENPPGAAAGAAGGAETASGSPTNRPASPAGGGGGAGAANFAQRAFNFATEQGAALIVTSSTRGDGGTLFVQSATVANANPNERSRPWAEGARVPPQVTLATEDFNRLARMLQRGASLTARVDLRVRFHDDLTMNHNVIAEIPGTDLAHEIVMIGAHIDSWHSSTGTTDNAVGVAATMEAVRILQATGLRPRRTIRIGLWSGEEQGLLGSRAYVSRHFARLEGSGSGPMQLVKGPEYDRLSAYFNLDNGTGRIRGIYAQGNAAVMPEFARWLLPLHDLAATTVTLSNTGSTDHASFDRVGLPGFQFIQDSIEYFTRTWHSNQDSFDRAQEADLKQASTVMASFIYRAAMADERLPRKPLPPNVTIAGEDVAASAVASEAPATR